MEIKVPYSYLPQQFANIEHIFDDLRKVIKEGDFTLGPRLEKFEKQFAELIGVKHAIGVGSGTDALFLSLKALGIGAGDEVITAVNTFVATAGAIETAGAKIVFVDCDDKYTIDLNQIEKVITPKTKAIMPVHFSGQPVDMEKLMLLAKKYNLHVVEDACCAIDAGINGKYCGSFGITAAFSLHPLKNLNVWSDGGLITTNSDQVAEKLRLMRNHGMINRDEYAFYAYNSRLDSIQAVVGSHLIKDVKWITNQRIKWAEYFDEKFKDLSHFITIPARSKAERRVYHMYMLLVKDRSQLCDYLNKAGIEAKIHYPIPLHLQQASAHLGYKKGDFPVAESQAENIISLPVHQHLSQEQVDYVASKVREFYQGKN